MEKKNNDDKPKIAVALEYTPGEQAPKILATGRGYIAESIIEKAGEADVPVCLLYTSPSPRDCS